MAGLGNTWSLSSLARILTFKLLLRLGGIEGWRTLEIICHHWLALMVKLLLRLDGIEECRALEIIGVCHHGLALIFKLLLRLGGIKG